MTPEPKAGDWVQIRALEEDPAFFPPYTAEFMDMSRDCRWYRVRPVNSPYMVVVSRDYIVLLDPLPEDL